jgi:hypothetical protein
MFALVAGVVFLLCSQSLFGALVVTMSFLESGVFDFNQTFLFAFGCYLGAAILKSFYLPAFKDVFKQLVAVIPVYYAVAFLISATLYFLENTLGVFSFTKLAMQWSTDQKIVFAHVNLIVHLLTTSILTLAMGPLMRFVNYMGTPKPEGVVIADVDIPIQVLDDPHMTLALIQMEERRLVEYFPDYFENIRSGKSRQHRELQQGLHTVLDTNFGVIDETFSNLLNRTSYDDNVSHLLLTSIALKDFLWKLEGNLYEFAETIGRLQADGKGANDQLLQRKLSSFVESMDIILFSVIDAMSTLSEFDIGVVEKLTAERKGLMEEVGGLFRKSLSIEQQADLVNLVHLFESNLWVVGQIVKMLKRRPEGSAEEGETN